jgi:hypothetical protein
MQLEIAGYVNGQRQLTPLPQFMWQTNDLGRVRLHGLAPGRYFLTANPVSVGTRDPLLPELSGAAQGTTWVPTYYPGTVRQSDARSIVVGPAEEVSVGFALSAARAARVSGTLRQSNGTPSIGTRLTLRPVNSFGTPRETGSLPDGSFGFANVAPGDYQLDAFPPLGPPRAGRDPGLGPDSPLPVRELLTTTLSVVGDDIVGLTLVTTLGGSVRGLVSFDSGVPPQDLSPAALMLRGVREPPASGPNAGTGYITVRADWTFGLAGMIGGWLLRLDSAEGWYLKSVEHHGRDVTDVPLVLSDGTRIEDVRIVMTQKITEVRGRATTVRRDAATDYAAIIFSEDRERWTSATRFIRAGRPEREGGFVVRGLPPGSYLAVAVDYLESGEENDPELLASLVSGATRLTIGEGETKDVTLTVVERR